MGGEGRSAGIMGKCMHSFYTVAGTITEIQRFSIHDGPGIRTLVFFKGCPLRCRWCCNPETLRVEPQTITLHDETKTVGRKVTVDELMDEIRKDAIYYRRSGGGITLSGGEALFQPDFCEALLRACKEEGLHTALETSAFAPYAVFERLLPWLDLILCDLKHVDADKHKAGTGVSNERILENQRRLGFSGVPMVIRTPVVPGFNATPEDIAAISLYAATIPGVRDLHLLPYHRLGESKYVGLGMHYDYAGIAPLSGEEMGGLLAVAERSGLCCRIGG